MDGGSMLKGLCSCFAMTLVALGGDVASLRIPPAHSGTNAPSLLRLLGPSDRPLKTAAEWLVERQRILRQWQKVLGPVPELRPALLPEILSEETVPEFSRKLVRYQIEEGVFADGYLLEPIRRKGKLPAVVVFHPTTPAQAKGVAGVDTEYPEDKRQGVQLVNRGYVVWCPKNFINAGTGDWKANTAKVTARHPDWTGMTRMLLDAIRAADFLESLPFVDAGRIGCLGHSLGAKEVLYAMAFDSRYKAGVFSEGGIGLSFSNWDAPWYLGTQIKAPDFKLEHHQLLALIAPRAFLLLAGDSADDDRSWSFIEAASPVYGLFQAGNRIGWLNHHEGHAYPERARWEAEDFLDRFLK